MTQHTKTPWILQEVTSDTDQSYRVVSNAENEIDNFGSGWGDISGASGLIFHDAHYYPMSPNKEDAAFIVRACNSHDALVEALEKVVLEQERLFDVLSSSSDGSVENRFMLNFLKNQIKENIDIITKARGEVSQ